MVRWEKTTRPFLRSSEFLWQEGHTMHETAEEAQEFTLKIFQIYEDFYREALAHPRRYRPENRKGEICRRPGHLYH